MRALADLRSRTQMNSMRTLRFLGLITGVLLLTACGGTPLASVPTTRVVIVVDVTVRDSARFETSVLQPLATAVQNAREDTWVDLFVVSDTHYMGNPDLRDSLPFNPQEPDQRGHHARARALALRLTSFLREARRNSHPDPKASCILNTLYMARESFAPRSAREHVRLAVLSDLVEQCPGGDNLAQHLPTRFSPASAYELPLSGLDAVHLWRVEHPAFRGAARGVQISHLWSEYLEQQGAREVSLAYLL